jgi:hypothetical protein
MNLTRYNATELSLFRALLEYKNFPFHLLVLQNPTVHLQVTIDKKVVAYCSLFKDQNCFGHFWASDKDAGFFLLEALVQEAKEVGPRALRGPMDSSTWFSYRLVTKSSGGDAFLLEPQNPLWYGALFESLGYVKETMYHSTLTSLVSAYDSRTSRVKARLEKNAISVRPMDFGDESDWDALYALSMSEFASSDYFTPITQAHFKLLHQGLTSVTVPELCLVVVDGKEIVGFMFAYIDKHRVILKSTAVRQKRAYQGSVIVLIEQILEYAKTQGCDEVVYALMRKENQVTTNTIHQSARALREYALYVKYL